VVTSWELERNFERIYHAAGREVAFITGAGMGRGARGRSLSRRRAQRSWSPHRAKAAKENGRDDRARGGQALAAVGDVARMPT